MSQERRESGIVLVLSVVTCGIYLFFWYHETYRELEELAGETPTGNSYWVDLLLNFVTCSLYGIFVDYKISQQIEALYRNHSVPNPPDTATAAILLDVAAFFTGYFTNFITSAIHQDHLNKLVRHLDENQALPGFGAPPGLGPPPGMGGPPQGPPPGY